MKTSPLFFLLGLGMLAVPGIAQTSPSDSQTLKDILVEVRAIHNDVRLSETTQILLTEEQLQQTTVNTALQRRNSLRSDLAQLQADEKENGAKLARAEDASSSPPADPKEKEELAEFTEGVKAELAKLKGKDEVLTKDMQEAELRLRDAESRLDTIQAQLDEVVKKLQPVGNP
jgi:chromosome segregation ATPase